MDKRTQELGEIKKEMEREDEALYAIKNKIRHLEDVEEDIQQSRREMDDILNHMKEVWRGEHAGHTFWQIEDEVNHYNRKTACMINDIQIELNNEQKKHRQNLHALETKQQDITKEMRL
ncbi:TPA: DUF3958 family protein [Listeria innocua]|uniref:DUF3958 family protein n=1 Tax=Listeria innocua TaxID=1642 RepID=UPI0017E7F48A|nr:DUF3958 family protein [Listeria innocua]EIR7349111.1 DUF3958 family protein [Listeria innocua]EMD1120434.1 DUF3958 family protein [Listeria innocua]MBF2699220.1 DUF3958 family protein [Listeria innocua]HBM3461964.1 DUF3958 family protein [Listeria innocua]HBM3524985.1 DUF3958 family protein [Listeria innocua]